MNRPINLPHIMELIEKEISDSVPECRKYLLYQIGGNKLNFSINFSCPAEGAQKMEKIMLKISEDFGLVTKTGRMPD